MAVKVRTALLLCILTVMFSCGHKEVKPVSPESKNALDAFALAETIRQAFVKKDLSALQQNSTDTGYRDIMTSRKTFDSIDLTFTPRWVELENRQVMLNVTWKSVWATSEKKTEDRGMAIFVMEGIPLKLSKILRANPFVYPEQ